MTEALYTQLQSYSSMIENDFVQYIEHLQVKELRRALMEYFSLNGSPEFVMDKSHAIFLLFWDVSLPDRLKWWKHCAENDFDIALDLIIQMEAVAQHPFVGVLATAAPQDMKRSMEMCAAPGVPCRFVLKTDVEKARNPPAIAPDAKRRRMG